MQWVNYSPYNSSGTVTNGNVWTHNVHPYGVSAVGYTNACVGIVNIRKEVAEKPMKTLYNVIVVTMDEEIILDIKTVAENEEEAKFNVGVFELLIKRCLKPKNVTVICNILGAVKVEEEAR